MILNTLRIDSYEIERRTGWSIKPEGACKGDRCVPLPGRDRAQIDVRVLAERLTLPLIHDAATGLWCLGPEAGGRALAPVVAPELILPDLHGRDWRLSALRATKVLLVTWASW